MFRFIELLGLLILLWFIVNFVRYAVWAVSGIGGEEGMEGFVFGMSSHWIKQSKAEKEVESKKEDQAKRK